MSKKHATVTILPCETGNEYALINEACKTYIGATDDIDGASADFFAIRFFYELYQNKRTTKQAFDIARSTDSETEFFCLVSMSNGTHQH